MWYLKTYLLTFLIFLFLSACGNNVEHFSNSIDLANQATRIANEAGTFELSLGGAQLYSIAEDDLRKIVNYCKQALEEARKVDIEKLNRRYAGFGDHYRDEFMRGIKLFAEGWEQKDAVKCLAGQVLLDRWGTWYSNNIDEIRKS